MLKTEITMELNNNIIEKTQGSLKRRTFLKWHTFGILFTLLILGSCTKDLLEQIPTTELSPELFWRTTNDAAYAVNGVYEANRTTFGRDYYFDGAGEFVYTRGTSWGKGTYRPEGIGGSFDFLWQSCYTTINRANYVIENIRTMKGRVTNSKETAILERLEGEARFLRGLNYFRLIDLWGDVPYFTRKLTNKEAYNQERVPRAQIKDSILADFTFATSVLPLSYQSSDLGRATKMAAQGFCGKVKLYWACWMKNEGNVAEAQTYYTQAAADFKEVMNPANGLSLFMNGEPGNYHTPNYYKLFEAENEYNPEVIFSVQYGGPLLGQGEELLRDFGTRNTGFAQTWIMPTTRIADRYQLTTTGEYAAPIVFNNKPAQANGSINPQTYVNRDWRMKATILWDGQKYPTMSQDAMVLMDSLPLKFKTKDGINYINYSDGVTGYIFRKFVRSTAGMSRSDGKQDFYLMRLPDVWLMYCEAVNEVNGGPTLELFSLIDQIRHRGNLPGLNKASFASKDDFFRAIEQERIVELIAEGHRYFDIRRWNKVETIWPSPNGQVSINTWGERIRDEFKNAQPRDYGRYKIFRIPTSEREVNPKLTQTEPWL
jgi:hypothetical protein